MRLRQFLKGEQRGEPPWIPDFQTVFEKHDLDAGMGSQFLMAYGIDDGFENCILGQFPYRFCKIRSIAVSHVHVKMFQDKLRCAIHLLKKRSADLLQRWHGAIDCRAIELGAFDFNGRKESLGARIEKQNCRVCHTTVFTKQIKMFEDFIYRSRRGQGEIPFYFCRMDKGANTLCVKILPCQGCITASVERTAAQNLLLCKKTYKRGIQRTFQIIDGSEGLADDFAFDFGNEFLLFRMPRSRHAFMDENDPIPMVCRCRIIFTLCRRYAFGIFMAIFVAEKPKIDITVSCFLQKDLLDVVVMGWQTLEHERLEELPEQKITADIVKERGTLFGEFPLNTAYE